MDSLKLWAHSAKYFANDRGCSIWSHLGASKLTHPSVPEAEFGVVGSPGDATAVGFSSAWLCAAREMTTVEIACLKMSCSWLLVSRTRSEEHTSELQSPMYLVCRL